MALTSQQQELLRQFDKLEAGRNGASAVWLNRQLNWGLKNVEAVAEELTELRYLEAQATPGGVKYIRLENPAVKGQAEAGSLFKLFATLTALEPGKIKLAFQEKFVANGIKEIADWIVYLKERGNILVTALRDLGFLFTSAEERHIQELEDGRTDRMRVLVDALLFLSRKTRAEPALSTEVIERGVASLEPIGAEVDGHPEVDTEREFAGIRNRWEVLHILPSVCEFIRYHDINSIVGLVNKLGHYGSVAEAFAMAGGIEISQPIAEEIRAILPGLSKFHDRLDLASLDPVMLAAPPASPVPQPLPEPVITLPTPPAEKGEDMPKKDKAPAKKPVKEKGEPIDSALPDDVLLKGCEFIRTRAWRELNDKGITTFADLLRLILDHGDVKEAFKSLGVSTMGHTVLSLRNRLDLFRKYGGEFDKISPDEASRIVGRLKERAQRARQKAGKKAAPALPSASPAQTGIVPAGMGIVTRLELARLEASLAIRQGKLAEKLLPVAAAISGIDDPTGVPDDSLEGIVRAIENDLGLLGVRANIDPVLLEMARHVLAIQKADLAASTPPKPSK